MISLGFNPSSFPPFLNNIQAKSDADNIGGHSEARGKLGPRDGIPYQTASRLPVANQDFL